MRSQNLPVSVDVCGREIADGVLCGAEATVWGLVRGKDYWKGFQVAACNEHRNELIEHSSIYMTSDTPILQEDVDD